MKPLHHNIQKFGKSNKFYTPLCSHFLAAHTAIVEIILIKQLRFNISLQTQFDTSIINLLVNILDDKD